MNESSKSRRFATLATSGFEFLWGVFVRPQRAIVQFVEQPSAPVVALVLGLAVFSEVAAPAGGLWWNVERHAVEQGAFAVGQLLWLAIVFFGLLVGARPPATEELSARHAVGVLCVFLWLATVGAALSWVLPREGHIFFGVSLRDLGMGFGLMSAYVGLVHGVGSTKRRALFVVLFLVVLSFFRTRLFEWVAIHILEVWSVLR